MTSKLIGRRYDRLTVESRSYSIKADSGHYDTVYLCRCDCGAFIEKRLSNLRQKGYIHQCPSCIKAANDAARAASTDHPLRGIYDGMIFRCHGTGDDESHQYYRDRGIVVCARWRESFASFIDDMGPRPDGHTLDRIDNDGPYSPDNCRWATHEQQIYNRSNTLWVTLNGRTAHLRDWCAVIGRPAESVAQTAKDRGVTLEEVILRAYGAKQAGRKNIKWPKP